MPERGVDLVPRADVLTFEEIERLVAVFADLGVTRLRLTGGEPTVRKDLVDLCQRLSAIAGIHELAMTTNGHRLRELAEPLVRAGLGEVNVSIDTVSASRFRALTRRGDLDRVIQGIDAAVAAGLTVKLNAVALAGINHDELGAICSFAWARGLTPRFIEHMPMSDGELYSPSRHLGAEEIRTRVAEQLGAEVSPAVVTSPKGPRGPARYFRTEPGGREFGIISAMTEHFCATCNRVRLSATGQLHACLAFDDAVDLRGPLRAGATPAELAQLVTEALGDKREGHQFQVAGLGAPRKHMVAIGG